MFSFRLCNFLCLRVKCREAYTGLLVPRDWSSNWLHIYFSYWVSWVVRVSFKTIHEEESFSLNRRKRSFQSNWKFQNEISAVLNSTEHYSPVANGIWLRQIRDSIWFQLENNHATTCHLYNKTKSTQSPKNYVIINCNAIISPYRTSPNAAWVDGSTQHTTHRMINGYQLWALTRQWFRTKKHSITLRLSATHAELMTRQPRTKRERLFFGCPSTIQRWWIINNLKIDRIAFPLDWH